MSNQRALCHVMRITHGTTVLFFHPSGVRNATSTKRPGASDEHSHLLLWRSTAGLGTPLMSRIERNNKFYNFCGFSLQQHIYKFYDFSLIATERFFVTAVRDLQFFTLLCFANYLISDQNRLANFTKFAKNRNSTIFRYDCVKIATENS